MEEPDLEKGCADALWPATWTFSLPDDAQVQEYAVEIVLDGETDEYVVRAGVAGTSLVPVHTSFSRPRPH